ADAWIAWQRTAESHASSLDVPGETSHDDVAARLKDETTALFDDLRAALVSQVSGATKEKIEELLGERKYHEAINEIAAASRRAYHAPSQEGRIAGPEIPAELSARPTISVVQFAPPGMYLPSGAIAFTTTSRQDVTPVDVLAASARRAVQDTNTLLSVIYAA